MRLNKKVSKSHETFKVRDFVNTTTYIFIIKKISYSVDEKQSKNHPKNGADPTTTTYGATNSAAYGAAHASNYDQYGSR